MVLFYTVNILSIFSIFEKTHHFKSSNLGELSKQLFIVQDTINISISVGGDTLLLLLLL